MGREQTFFIAYGNTGNVDAPATELRVDVPKMFEVTAAPRGPDGSPAFVIDNGDDSTALQLFVPKVPAGSVKYIPTTVTSTSPRSVPPGSKLPKIPRTSNIKATFDEPIDCEEVLDFQVEFAKKGTTRPVEGTISCSEDGKTAVFDPEGKLPKKGTFKATVKAKDLAGNESAAKTWSFKTKK